MLQGNKEDLMMSFCQRCQERDLNMTPQRTAIYEELLESKDHPCAEDVYDRVKKILPGISLDTVYRTLTSFADMGVVHVVEGYSESKRYDPDIRTHHHFRCQKCNKIVDFSNKDYDNLKIPREFRKKFKVKNVKVILEGVCGKCSKK